MLKYLVSGTGRCGTVFAARFLTSIGVPCTHEAVFGRFGVKSAKFFLAHPEKRQNSHCSQFAVGENHHPISQWFHGLPIAESSYLLVHSLHLSEIADVPLIHIVRDPLKVVSSFVGDLNYFKDNESGDLYQHQIRLVLPELIKIPTQIERACYFYVRWNLKLEKEKGKRPYLFTKIEHAVCNPKVWEFVNKPMGESFNETKINTFKIRTKDLTLNDIPEGSIKEDFKNMMSRYGYAKKIL